MCVCGELLSFGAKNSVHSNATVVSWSSSEERRDVVDVAGLDLKIVDACRPCRLLFVVEKPCTNSIFDEDNAIRTSNTDTARGALARVCRRFCRTDTILDLDILVATRLDVSAPWQLFSVVLMVKFLGWIGSIL